MSKNERHKPIRIVPPEGVIVDSIAAHLGDDKISRDVAAEQARASAEAIGWSPESGKRKRWVGWDDWDSVRDN